MTGRRSAGRGYWDVLLLVMLIVVGGGAPSPLAGGPASGKPAADRSTGEKATGGSAAAPERIAVTRPTYVYALPDPRSRVILIAMPGDKLVVVPSTVRTGPLRGRVASKECCRDGLYDPDQQIDIIDRVGEGYVPIFHTTLSALAEAPADSEPDGSAACKGDRSSEACRNAAGLRDPSGLGSWIQVSTPDGRHRGWALLPHR